MSRNSRRNRKPSGNPLGLEACGMGCYDGNNMWQSDFMNSRAAITNMNWIMRLAASRFRWKGLPDSCDERYLKQTLLYNGMATVCHDKNDFTKTWLSLGCASIGDYDRYGNPKEWLAIGYNGSDNIACDKSNAVIIWENESRISPWPTLMKYAYKLTRYDRTEDVNLAMQFATVMFTAPKDQQMQLIDTVQQIAGFEPIVAGIEGYEEEINIEVLKSGVAPIIDELATGRQNTWNDIYRFLGINHLAFEKGERMIEEEASANAEPAAIMLMDELSAQRKGAEELSELLGTEITVEFNDYETVRRIAGETVTAVEGASDGKTEGEGE